MPYLQQPMFFNCYTVYKAIYEWNSDPDFVMVIKAKHKTAENISSLIMI